MVTQNFLPCLSGKMDAERDIYIKDKGEVYSLDINNLNLLIYCWTRLFHSF